MATWICKKCGEENGENTKICLNCGEDKNSKIATGEVESNKTDEKYICPICNSVYSKPYCNECDRTIPANCRKGIDNDIDKARKKLALKYKIKLICVFIAAAAIVGAIFIGVRPHSNNASPSVQSDTSGQDNIVIPYEKDTYDYDTTYETPKSTSKSDGLVFKSSVPNDVTGNWRVAFMYDYKKFENVSIKEYIPQYYRKYFKNDNEVHFIINQRDKQTICVTCGLDILFVTVKQYVYGEEKDANLLGSGAVLSEYQIDL